MAAFGFSVPGCSSQEGDVYETTADGATAQVMLLESGFDGNGDVVFEWIRILDEDDRSLIDESRTGILDNHTFQRAARPHLYSGAAEPFLYIEDAWEISRDDGQIEAGYRVIQVPNIAPIEVRPPFEGPSIVDDRVIDEVDVLLPGESIELLVKFRDYPQIPIPMRAPPEIVEPEEVGLAASLRDAAFAERVEAMVSASVGLRAWLEDIDGVFLNSFDGIGWALILVPGEHVEALLHRDDLERISSNHEPHDSDQGDRLGELRVNERLGAEEYWNNGYTGDGENPGQHGHDRLVAAVVEAHYMENHSPCYLLSYFDANCDRNAGRIIDSYDCQSGTCTSSLPFPAANRTATEAFHGTAVSSIILADYTDFQGAFKPLGDPNYDPNLWFGTGGHSPDWIETSTGMAPSSSLRFFGGTVGCVGCYADAYTQAAIETDVLNMSHRFSAGTICDVASTGIREDALAEAYDNGVFLVAAAGNTESTSCNVAMPAVMPRVFAVNGLQSDAPGCRSDYTTCPISSDKFTTGGAARPDNLGLVTIIDAAAPAHVRRATTVDTNTDYGRVTEGRHNGTSFAAPLVAGLALLVKEERLDNGSPWVNNPGRMHALMLAMTDRWGAIPDIRHVDRGDNRSGFGRAKLRSTLTGTNQTLRRWNMRSHTHTASSGHRNYFAWSTPTQGNVSHIKCVMGQGEDHRNNTDVADVYLRLRLRYPVSGQCSAAGSLIMTRMDSTYDLKHMVAFSDTEVPTAGVCVEVNIINVSVPSGESLPTSTFCYGATIDDNQPN